MNDDIRQTIEEWLKRIDLNQQAHYAAASHASKWHYAIGLPATLLATIAGATLLTESNEPWIRIVVGIIGLIAAALAAVQTFYSFAKRAESHQSTAAQLGSVSRNLQWLLVCAPDDKEKLMQAIRDAMEEVTKIDSKAPLIDIGALTRLAEARGGFGSSSKLLLAPISSEV